jgi:hypothetical protein
MKSKCESCLKIVTTNTMYICRGLKCTMRYCEKCYKKFISLCNICNGTLLCEDCRKTWNICPYCLKNNVLLCTEEISLEFEKKSVW